jgi:hypothetical protein
MGVQAPLMAGATFFAPEAGAGAGMAALANPITAALAAAALGTAYGVSPSVRKMTNKAVKAGWEGLTNPIQHFGDGTEGDKIGALFGRVNTNFNPENMLNGQSSFMDLRGLPGAGGMDTGFLKNLLGKSQNPDQRQQQATQALGGGGNTQPIPAMPSPIAMPAAFTPNPSAQPINGFYPNLLSRRVY